MKRFILVKIKKGDEKMKKLEKDIQASLLKVTGINYSVKIIDKTKKNKNKKEGKIKNEKQIKQ